MGTAAQPPHPAAKSRPLLISGLSGNEAFCLSLKGLAPGRLVMGNSVQSLGFFGGLASGLRNLAGGESTDLTQSIKAGRDAALHRMEHEATQSGALGVSGVASQLQRFEGHIEFLSTGSAVHGAGSGHRFTSSFDGKELYCALDAGYEPRRFAFGTIAYSMGLGSGLSGLIKTLVRGEIKDFSDVLNHTRHEALRRLLAEATGAGGNAVLGIEIDVMVLAGFHEMLMTGTVAYHPRLTASTPATSALSCDELWSVARMGYAPVQLVMSTAVYSLGIVGGFKAAFRAARRGEIPELTSLIYEAREHVLDQIQAEAQSCGAEAVFGTDVYIKELGGGLVEFMALGTAVKRTAAAHPASDMLPAQAVSIHRRAFRMSDDPLLAGAEVKA